MTGDSATPVRVLLVRINGRAPARRTQPGVGSQVEADTRDRPEPLPEKPIRFPR